MNDVVVGLVRCGGKQKSKTKKKINTLHEKEKRISMSKINDGGFYTINQISIYIIKERERQLGGGGGLN
jgi:hypothetical protein